MKRSTSGSSLSCLRPRLAPASPGGWKPDSVRGDRHARGYGTEWERLRARIMRRDNGLCQPCTKAGFLKAARQVDHITSKAAGGSDDESNLQAICIPCHREKTARESRGASS